MRAKLSAASIFARSSGHPFCVSLCGVLCVRVFVPDVPTQQQILQSGTFHYPVLSLNAVETISARNRKNPGHALSCLVMNSAELRAGRPTKTLPGL